MRNLILSFILTLTLTACGGGSTASTAPDTTPVVETCATDITECVANTETVTFAETLGTITPEMQTEPANIHVSLTAAADAATQQTPTTVTLPAIAVLFTDSTAYTRGNALLPWEVGGVINPTGLNIARTASLSRTDILGDSPYPTVSLTFNGTAITATINADESYTGVTAITDVNAILGFDSDDIAYISWDIPETTAVFDTETPSKYSKQGMLIAGVETTDSHIGTAIGATGEAVFTGKGRGYERLASDNSLNYLRFTATATVNFATPTVTLASTASMACDSDFANCNSADNKYNFTSEALAFTDNNISGAITNSNSSYTGVADARFYSTKATDLAGSFALNDASNNYYYGVFGGKRGSFDALDVLISFDDPDRNGTQDNQLPALFVEITRQETSPYAVTTVSDNTGTVEFDYDSFGDWEGASDPLIFYFTDKTYKITIQTGTANLIQTFEPTKYIDSGENDKPEYLILNRRMSVFGTFQAQYMAVARWWLNKTGYVSYGYGITGFETAGNALPEADISFTGRGVGRYGNAAALTVTNFNVTADVDVTNRTVTVASNITCTDATNDTTCSNTSRPDLEFTATLGYAENSNVLSTANSNGVAFSTTGGAYVGGSTTSLTGGTAEARFYGPNTEEIGGTFNASNATSAYIGFFGGKQ